MSTPAKGTLVQHVSLGIGKVVAVEATAVHVFFPANDRRFAAKLRWPLASRMLSARPPEPDPWLEGLSSFTLDAAAGRYALAQGWLSHEEAVAEFLARVPQGFSGAARGGRNTWRAARARWEERLGNGQAEALLAAGRVSGLARRALEVREQVARIPGMEEEAGLAGTFGDPGSTRAYFEALVDVLGAPTPGRARFERLFAATAALPAPAGAAWTLATLFPFLAHPERHMLLHRSARNAAERLGCDLRYDAAPNWTTYAALRAFSANLLGLLKPNGAADLTDVESFLRALAARPAGSRLTARGRARAAPRAAAGAQRRA